MHWSGHPYHYPPGTKIKLFRALGPDKKGPEEDATLLTSYMTNSEDNEHPVFRTESGDIVRGCECWWIPAEVADDAGKYLPKPKYKPVIPQPKPCNCNG